MKYKDILYPAAIGWIDRLLASVDEYFEVNEDPEEFVENSYDILDSCRDKIDNVYMEDLGDPCMMAVLDELEGESCFDGFPIEEDFIRLKKVLQLSGFIESDGDIDLDDDIVFDDAAFSLSECRGAFSNFSIFGYHNSARLKDSLVFIDLSARDLHSNMEDSGLSNGLIALLIKVMSKIEEDEGLDFSKAYILFSSEGSSMCAESALRMHAALQGKIIHTEISANSLTSSSVYLDRISPRDPYSQFEETLIVLSEFNSASDLLRKYISLYHVIENFMFKVPLANLGRDNNGDVFSLRDFRRLSEAVQGRELDALTNVFKKESYGNFWKRSVNGDSFENIVNGSIARLTAIQGWDTVDCNQFLSRLAIRGISSYTNLCNDLNVRKYCEIVYKVRCSVVHNKETELHLSYSNMNPTIAVFIEEALMKPLYALISDLLTDKNSKVWYTGPELRLYPT
ncbi:hypothetical protein MARLIPOL_03960 [Marinobacter lipolyticus SM19]|uniref:Uncharacterized protein n=1 Tax=Marinobacter lipolyticus SM19 TaxID=1318628 RepID=R8B3H7_9GAMM|nr:hypothetical protein [Marinobacter lipolyticus]EON93158.1 hypothetical protein MARLIPOL_03960 [Marinobacter lipolyticus SM19]